MAEQSSPFQVTQSMLKDFVTRYRLARATLGGVQFYMNPDIDKMNQWLVQMAPTGSGYVRWVFGAQPYTIKLNGTTGILGYDGGDDTIGSIRTLYKRFAPGWDATGYGNQNKPFSFSFPSVGIRTDQAYVDSFELSQSSQRPLFIFFSIQLTILPPKIARDYQAPTPIPTTLISGSSIGTATGSSVGNAIPPVKNPFTGFPL